MPITTGQRPAAVSVYDYILCETDTVGVPQYFGYEDRDGNWYIAQNNSGVWRYEIGVSDFSTAWTNRATQSYGYPSAKW